jgi:hypothetical protein
VNPQFKAPEVIKPDVVQAVLEYYRDPFIFELRCIFGATYACYPEQWREIVT